VSEANDTNAERNAERRVFVIHVRYVRPLAEVDAHVEAHRAWLDEHYRQGHFLMSGPLEPREGGVIIAYGRAREDVESWLPRDPFARAGVAEYEILEFRPARVHPSMPFPLGDSQDG